MKHISLERIVQMALLMVWALACFAFFQMKYPYHFFYQEQNQLFLLSGEYIQSYFQKPAGVACLVGDFLTQLYYYMYAGATILTVSLLIMGDLLYRCLFKALSSMDKVLGHRQKDWTAFAIAICAMTICARLSLYENYKLSSIIAIVGGCAMFWIMDIITKPSVQKLKTKTKTMRMALYSVCIVVGGCLTYIAFGYGFFYFFILALIRIPGWCKENYLQGWRPGFLVTMNFVPLLVGIIPFAPRYYNLTIDDALTYPGIGKWVDYNAEMVAERNLRYDNTYYFGNYNKVINMYETEHDEPTDEMSFFYCLSLEHNGQLAGKLPNMKNPNLGTFLKIDDKTPLFQIKMINELYFLLGDMTYTERAALLANTFSPNGRNVRMVKRLAEANLISGDTVAAMKYLRLLSKTIVYRQWADAHTPDAMSPAVKAEIEHKRQMVNTTDHIRIGDDCYVILTQLLDSNPKNTVALDYLLCSDMLSHQREVFIRDYEKYGPSDRQIFQQVYNSAK